MVVVFSGGVCLVVFIGVVVLIVGVVVVAVVGSWWYGFRSCTHLFFFLFV